MSLIMTPEGLVEKSKWKAQQAKKHSKKVRRMLRNYEVLVQPGYHYKGERK